LVRKSKRREEVLGMQFRARDSGGPNCELEGGAAFFRQKTETGAQRSGANAKTAIKRRGGTLSLLKLCEREKRKLRNVVENKKGGGKAPRRTPQNDLGRDEESECYLWSPGKGGGDRRIEVI